MQACHTPCSQGTGWAALPMLLGRAALGALRMAILATTEPLPPLATEQQGRDSRINDLESTCSQLLGFLLHEDLCMRFGMVTCA